MAQRKKPAEIVSEFDTVTGKDLQPILDEVRRLMRPSQEMPPPSPDMFQEDPQILGEDLAQIFQTLQRFLGFPIEQGIDKIIGGPTTASMRSLPNQPHVFGGNEEGTEGPKKGRLMGRFDDSRPGGRVKTESLRNPDEDAQIFINPTLDADEKFITLAHEVAHSAGREESEADIVDQLLEMIALRK
mgnify:CR=1 FL=1